MAQLKHVQGKLAQENKDEAQRAEVLIKEMKEMRTELVELKMEGRFDQNELESSIASISNLIRQRENLVYVRMSEMTAVMKERDRQTDERLKLISETMHHGTLILRTAWCHDLSTTVQDLTLGVKYVVAQTSAVPSRTPPVSVAFNSANIPSTSAFPTQQPTYREVVLSRNETQAEQTKQPKVQPPAMYKKRPAKS